MRPRSPRRVIPRFQAVKYLRAFLFGRLGWNQLGGNLIISGGIRPLLSLHGASGGGGTTPWEGTWCWSGVSVASGYETGGPHRVDFVPDPVAWTEVPETLAVLGRQRDRWHSGLADVLWRHRHLTFNPRNGAMGVVALPEFFLVELPAPVMEAIGRVRVIAGGMLGMINWPLALLFFLVAYGLGTVLSFLTLLLEELSFREYSGFRDRARMSGWALLEHLGNRQLTVIWRLSGLEKYLRGRKDWRSMQRRGFSAAKPSWS